VASTYCPRQRVQPNAKIANMIGDALRRGAASTEGTDVFIDASLLLVATILDDVRCWRYYRIALACVGACCLRENAKEGTNLPSKAH
jgi:hypothetical protein